MVRFHFIIKAIFKVAGTLRVPSAIKSFDLVIKVLLISSEQRSGTGTRANKGCFDLVIEVLLISSSDEWSNDQYYDDQFRSRNRGSFNFK